MGKRCEPDWDQIRLAEEQRRRNALLQAAVDGDEAAIKRAWKEMHRPLPGPPWWRLIWDDLLSGVIFRRIGKVATFLAFVFLFQVLWKVVPEAWSLARGGILAGAMIGFVMIFCYAPKSGEDWLAYSVMFTVSALGLWMQMA